MTFAQKWKRFKDGPIDYANMRIPRRLKGSLEILAVLLDNADPELLELLESRGLEIPDEY